MLKNIADFTGCHNIDTRFFIDRNSRPIKKTRINETGWQLLRRKNIATAAAKKIFGLKKERRAFIYLKPETIKNIRGFYRESNSRFSAMTGFDLFEMGY